jgi:hypothetical protein
VSPKSQQAAGNNRPPAEEYFRSFSLFLQNDDAPFLYILINCNHLGTKNSCRFGFAPEQRCTNTGWSYAGV